MARFVMTTKQSTATKLLISKFYVACKSHPTSLPPQFLLHLKMVHDLVIEEKPLDQHEVDFIIFIMELIFNEFEDDMVWPSLEQAYCKLSGSFYPFVEPWYDRCVEHYDPQKKLGY